MAHQLERISFEGFKSIKSVELDIRPINLLIGANGAGKSNFVAAFDLLRDIVERRLQTRVAASGGASSMLHFGPKRTQEIRLRLNFGPNGYEVKLEWAQGDKLFISNEECWFHDKSKYSRPYTITLAVGENESGLQKEVQAKRGKIAQYVLESLKSWKIYHFHDTSKNAGIKQKQPIDDNLSLRQDATNLAAFLLRLREANPNSYRRIVSSVQLVAPFFDDFALRPDPIRPDKIQLEWRELGSDAYFGADSLSDGTLRFICLSALLLQPDLPTAILIDEPELGLHPYAIHQLAALVKAASQRSQVIISTQSVTLMNHFQPDDIVVVDRVEGESQFRRVDAADVESWADHYALGDIWEKNIIGGRPG